MHVFMHKHIDNTVDVKSNGNCEFHAISTLIGKNGENWALVSYNLIKELKTHKNDTRCSIRLMHTFKKFSSDS